MCKSSKRFISVISVATSAMLWETVAQELITIYRIFKSQVSVKRMLTRGNRETENYGHGSYRAHNQQKFTSNGNQAPTWPLTDVAYRLTVI
jgi:hypothetical protein